jgi:two-component system response regulator RegX3
MRVNFSLYSGFGLVTAGLVAVDWRAMQGNVLVIEDVAELAGLIELYLVKEGLLVRKAESAEAAFALLREWKADLVILDLNLPGMDGFEFLAAFRRDSGVPVVIVSARDADEDLIAGLGGGADEFVTKPFSPKVLSARVRALLRRARMPQGADEGRVFRFGPYALDFEACLLKKDGAKIPLTAKEFELLSYLAEHAGKPSAPEDIYNEVWKGLYGDVTTVAVHIQRLRKKVEADTANPRYIQTMHGLGYLLKNDEP